MRTSLSQQARAAMQVTRVMLVVMAMPVPRDKFWRRIFVSVALPISPWGLSFLARGVPLTKSLSILGGCWGWVVSGRVGVAAPARLWL